MKKISRRRFLKWSIRIGTPVLPVRNKNYSSGLKQSPRGTGIFISRGIGWSVYPVRFNCFPEIAILELVPARGSDGKGGRKLS